MDAETLGKLLLQQVELQATAFQVLSQSLRDGIDRLGGYPIGWAGATQPLDVQMAIGQRTPRPPCSSMTTKAGCCTIMKCGWRSSHRTCPRPNTSTIAPVRTTRTRI